MADHVVTDSIGEAEFRRRLAVKLAARGLPEADIPGRIEDLLRHGVALRLDVHGILDGAAPAPAE